jgi:hypothetical protein
VYSVELRASELAMVLEFVEAPERKPVNLAEVPSHAEVGEQRRVERREGRRADPLHRANGAHYGPENWRRDLCGPRLSRPQRHRSNKGLDRQTQAQARSQAPALVPQTQRIEAAISHMENDGVLGRNYLNRISAAASMHCSPPAARI